MDDSNSFIEKFKALLQTLPEDSFPDWEYAHRQITLTMTVEMLQRFPEAAIGPSPRKSGKKRKDKSVGIIVPHPDKGGGPGGWPSIVVQLGAIATEMHPPPPK